jgi:uncharacterized membrane protein YciS (DUF1049 family)
MWLGGGPTLGAKEFGIESRLLLSLLQGPFLLIAVVLIIAFCWFGFSIEVRRVDREIKRLANE